MLRASLDLFSIDFISLSRSFFLLCGNHWKIFSVNICCDPVTLVSGTALSARDTKMTEIGYWQCDNTLQYVTWRCPLLLLAFALPEGGLFLLEESGQMCSRWTESCLRSSCCTSWVALTLASTCLTPASFSSEPSYFYAYIMGQTKSWWKFFNAEFGTNAFLFLEIHVLILSGYFHSNRHNTWNEVITNSCRWQSPSLYFNGMRGLGHKEGLDPKSSENTEDQPGLLKSPGSESVLFLLRQSWHHPGLGADFNLPHQEAWWLYGSCIHIIRDPGWLTLITLWLQFFFFSPLQDGYCSEPTSLFQKVNIARRVFGNCLAICQEPDDLQQWTNAHNKETWLDYQLATSTSGGWLERRGKMVFSLGKYQEGFIILIEASA